MWKEKLKGTELWNVGKKFTLYFKSTADVLINESVNDLNNFYQTLLETALPLQQMMAKTLNNLNDDTINNIEQVNSISIHLLTFVSMLVDGQGISQPALTIAQLIQTNFGKNKNHDIQQSGKIVQKRFSCSSLFDIAN